MPEATTHEMAAFTKFTEARDCWDGELGLEWTESEYRLPRLLPAIRNGELQAHSLATTSVPHSSFGSSADGVRGVLLSPHGQPGTPQLEAMDGAKNGARSIIFRSPGRWATKHYGGPHPGKEHTFTPSKKGTWHERDETRSIFNSHRSIITIMT